MNTWNRDLFTKAWNFASLKHSGQTYGGAEEGVQMDYLTHIGNVVMEVTWCLQHTANKYDANLAIQCAVLHDTLEDTNATYDEIVLLFGQVVADGVLALTKYKDLSGKEEQMLDSLQRIIQQPPEIGIVKLADRISNLYQPPYYWTQEKIKSYIVESERILEKLVQSDQLLIERLRQKIRLYKKFIK